MTISGQNNHDETAWLRLGDAAKQLGISPHTLRRWSAAGLLPCYRSAGGQRRYRSVDVAALVRAQAIPTPQSAPAAPATPARRTAGAAQSPYAASIDALGESLALSLDPNEVAKAALALLGNLVEFDLGAVIVGDEGGGARLLCATPELADELTTNFGLVNHRSAFLTALVDPEVQESVEIRRLGQPEGLLAASAVLGEMRSAAVVGLYGQGERLGTLWLASRRASTYGARQKRVIANVTANLGRSLSNALLHERVKRSHLGILKALGSALGAKDYYSLSHATRVAGYMVLLGRELDWPANLTDQVEEAAYLHDIGKISVPDRVLTGGMALNEREWEMIKQHPVFGAEIMAPLFGKDLVLAVRHHHERYGGGGYPDGLVGKNIPVLARAMCVADCYDAMSYDRPYSGARPYADCLAELERGRGTQFDPVMVDAFLRVLRGIDAQRQIGNQAAAAAAARIDAEMHRRLALSRNPESADYAAISQILREERDAHPPTRYLSTVIREGERCIYLAGAGEDPLSATPMGIEVAGSSTLAHIFNSEPIEWNTLCVDEYGLWITSCHAPVVAPDGTVVALVLAAMPAPLSLHQIEESGSTVAKSIAVRRKVGREAAAAAAARIDTEMHRRLALSRDHDSADYATISQILREERDAHPPTSYLSTVIADGERCVYLAVGDDDPLSTMPMGVEVAGSDPLMRVLDGESLEWEALYADEYGLWITSCHAPVVAPDGKVVALVLAAMPAPPELLALESSNDAASDSFVATLRNTTNSLQRARLDSLTDYLTGLYNHRYLHERLAEELQRAHEQSLSLSLLFLDVDHFKEFNDRFGHLVGDAALRSVATAINNSVRRLDLAARYGGEEFVVVLPNTGLVDAIAVGEKIRAAIADKPVEVTGAKLSVSIGVATFPQDAETAEEIIDKADWAMFLAKRSGRNRVIAFAEAQLQPEPSGSAVASEDDSYSPTEPLTTVTR